MNADPDQDKTGDAAIRQILRRSIDVIESNQNESGAYPACEEFSAYAGYSWFRDGAFIADAMSRQGRFDSADRFHRWCGDVMLSNEAKVESLLDMKCHGMQPDRSQMLPTRFRFDGAVGEDPWWDFQLDGYGTWLWALGEHAARSGQAARVCARGAEIAVRYLAAFWNTPCFDWWEEHPEERHSSTFAAVYGGLSAASRMDVLDPALRLMASNAAGELRTMFFKKMIGGDGYVTKWIGTEAVDASDAACIVPFSIVDVRSPIARATLRRIDDELCVGEGVHRFKADVFFGGGQWPLLSCLLGWNYLALGERSRAESLFRWAVAQADGDKMVPEQVDQHLLHPESRSEWTQRWGNVAKPLLWSHAMILTLASALGYKC